MDVATVEAWIERAREVLAEAEEYPLIDSLVLAEEMEDEISRDADVEQCRNVLETAMARDPTDIAARFVALGFFYELLANARLMDEVEIHFLGKPTPAVIQRHLGELIRLLDVQACLDHRSVPARRTRRVYVRLRQERAGQHSPR